MKGSDSLRIATMDVKDANIKAIADEENSIGAVSADVCVCFLER